MKIPFFFCCVFLCVSWSATYAQNIVGLWRGSYYPNGTSPKDGKMLFLQFSVSQEEIACKLYNAQYNTEEYAIKRATVTSEKHDPHSLLINETIIAKQSRGGKVKWCRLQMNIHYDSLSGYFLGTYSSKECRNYSGKVVLYRYQGIFPEMTNDRPTIALESQLWWLRLDQDIQRGLNAPEIRQKERDNFVFQPIFFDFDKAEINLEFYPFLDRLIHILNGHTDLRILVIGHTDWDGSDAYNDKLSERRAQAIIQYFVDKGLQPDRLEFDFKGEKEPADTNQTPQGRQRNRRVDFQFI